MNDANYEHFCTLARDRSGLVLGSDKAYLVEGRLAPIATEEGLHNVDALLARLRAGATDMLIRKCVDAMATHETLFFRDRTPFEQLIETVVPSLLKTNAAKRSIKIWSAACSTGQEPYSIGMTLLDKAPALANWKIDIVATDLTDATIAQARAGKYSAFEVKRGLSDAELTKHFTKLPNEHWEVATAVKRMVTFRQHNLLDKYFGMGPFDIIFCRNVLIYFNRQTKSDVLNRMSTVLSPDGFLMLGSAETVVGFTTNLGAVKGARGVYAPVKATVGAAR